MAKKIAIQLISDLTGELIPEGEGETVSFAIDGTAYEMDLTGEEAQTMRELFAEYSDKARKIGRTASTGASSARRSGNPEETKKIRAWATENGITVSPRGRISGELREKYLAAQRQG